MDSRVEKALATFHKPYSCAQAVYAAFAEVDEAKLAELKAESGGRAEGGRCGALAAAQMLAPAEADAIAAEFAQVVGGTNCRAIKLEYKTPCQTCVQVAAECLAKRMA